MTKTHKLQFSVLAAMSLALILLYLLGHMIGAWDYVFPRRMYKAAAMVLTGGAIAISTVVFQTLTNNRILTPSIIGLDSVYMLFQTFIFYIFGSTSPLVTKDHYNFLVAVLLMLLFVSFLYKLMFQRESRHLLHLLLVGLVFGTFFGSMTTFMQVLIDPNEFLSLQGKMFASFNNVNTDLLPYALGILVLAGVFGVRYVKYLDVLSLGREHAVNLGLDYNRLVKQLLVLVAVLVALSTALVGPVTFLGLLTANLAYQLMGSYRHQLLLLSAFLISVVTLVGGQLLVERVFSFSTTLSVIVNFAGGLYFMYLLLRESKL